MYRVTQKRMNLRDDYTELTLSVYPYIQDSMLTANVFLFCLIIKKAKKKSNSLHNTFFNYKTSFKKLLKSSSQSHPLWITLYISVYISSSEKKGFVK